MSEWVQGVPDPEGSHLLPPCPSRGSTPRNRHGRKGPEALKELGGWEDRDGGGWEAVGEGKEPHRGAWRTRDTAGWAGLSGMCELSVLPGPRESPAPIAAILSASHPLPLHLGGSLS